MRRSLLATGATLALFLVVQLGALALANPFVDAGYQTVEDPSDPTNSVVYVVAILVATGVMLAAFRYDADVLIRGLIVFSSASLSYYALSILPAGVLVFGLNGVALAGALLVAVGLVVYPEWYVIDAAGILMGMGGAALFGISFGLLPAILLLTVLAVYDAISVYGTEHMLSLASGVMDLKVPVVLVIPMTWSYSYLDRGEAATDGGAEQDVDATTAEGDADHDVLEASTPSDSMTAEERPDASERDAFYIGLGDAVMPTVLVVSAAVFLDTPALVEGTVLTLPALTALVGTLAGLTVLVQFVMRGRAHAGLPLLNGGAIGGYLVGALLAGVPLLEALGLAPYL